jgi:hypothetical protein
MTLEADNVFRECGIDFSFGFGVYAEKLGSAARDASLQRIIF